MITARKTRLATRLLDHLLIRPACRGAFNTLSTRERGPRVPNEVPAILVANHSSWWDAHIVACYVHMRLARELYFVMEDTQLARYPLFRYGGGFGVSRTNGRDAARSIAYGAALLKARPNRVILMFPQGEILANDTRPLAFSSGAIRMAAGLSRVAFVPLAIRLEFIGEQKPDAFLSVGAAEYADCAALGRDDLRRLVGVVGARLTSELDQLKADVTGYRFESFRPLLRSNPGINRLIDAASGRPPLAAIGPL